MTHQGFGFCEFATPEDAEYACKIMNQVRSPRGVLRLFKQTLSRCLRLNYTENQSESTW